MQSILLLFVESGAILAVIQVRKFFQLLQVMFENSCIKKLFGIIIQILGVHAAALSPINNGAELLECLYIYSAVSQTSILMKP